MIYEYFEIILRELYFWSNKYIMILQKHWVSNYVEMSIKLSHKIIIQLITFLNFFINIYCLGYLNQEKTGKPSKTIKLY